jgi:hypothetical protein
MALILSPPRARARSHPAGARWLFAATPLLRLVFVVALAALGFVVLASRARGATAAPSGALPVSGVAAEGLATTGSARSPVGLRGVP